MGNDTSRVELLQGTPDLLILRTLVFGPSHGHAIASQIRATSQDVLQVETGSLYPPPSARGAGLGHLGLAAVGQGQAGEVLHPHGNRTTTAGRRAVEVGAALVGDDPHTPARGVAR